MLLNKIKDLWRVTWDRFYNSGTILYARIQAVVGLILGALAALDWSPLLNLAGTAGFNAKQAMSLSGILFVQGIVAEIVRRSNAKVVSDRLVPAVLAPELKKDSKARKAIAKEIQENK